MWCAPAAVSMFAVLVIAFGPGLMLIAVAANGRDEYVAFGAGGSGIVAGFTGEIGGPLHLGKCDPFAMVKTYTMKVAYR